MYKSVGRCWNFLCRVLVPVMHYRYTVQYKGQNFFPKIPFPKKYQFDLQYDIKRRRISRRFQKERKNFMFIFTSGKFEVLNSSTFFYV
jgi:hypothetical protein